MEVEDVGTTVLPYQFVKGVFVRADEREFASAIRFDWKKFRIVSCFRCKAIVYVVQDNRLHLVAQRLDVPEDEVPVQRLFRDGEPRGDVDYKHGGKNTKISYLCRH